MRRRWRLPLAYQLVAVQLVLITAVLLAVSAVSVEITRLGFARDEGRRVLTLAENLASNPIVRSDSAGGIWLRAENGNLLFQDTKVTSWDSALGTPDTDPVGGGRSDGARLHHGRHGRSHDADR